MSGVENQPLDSEDGEKQRLVGSKSIYIFSNNEEMKFSRFFFLVVNSKLLHTEADVLCSLTLSLTRYLKKNLIFFEVNFMVIST